MADEEKNFTLNFIEDYRSLPQLWDKNNKLYTNKIKRNDGLQVLATKYDMDVGAVKKKIKSLRSYFSKEHQKIIRKNSGAGSDELYHSPWFAYKYLLFTAESVTPRKISQSSIGEERDEQSEIFDTEESSVTSQSTYMSEDEHEFALPSKRKKRNTKRTKIDDKQEEGYKKATEELSPKDEFTIYGQLIAHKIRKLNSLNQLLAQQRINNILFDLEMEQVTGASATQNVNEMQDVKME